MIRKAALGVVAVAAILVVAASAQARTARLTVVGPGREEEYFYGEGGRIQAEDLAAGHVYRIDADAFPFGTFDRTVARWTAADDDYEIPIETLIGTQYRLTDETTSESRTRTARVRLRKYYRFLKRSGPSPYYSIVRKVRIEVRGPTDALQRRTFAIYVGRKEGDRSPPLLIRRKLVVVRPGVARVTLRVPTYRWGRPFSMCVDAAREDGIWPAGQPRGDCGAWEFLPVKL